MEKFNLFEYAIIRVVPRVEREEFLNVGVVLYCAKRKYLKTLLSLDQKRLQGFSKSLDIDFVFRNLNSFEQISAGTPESGPIGILDLPGRFRWLTAARSTVVQTSKVHAGFCDDPEEKLNCIFKQLVLVDDESK